MTFYIMYFTLHEGLPGLKNCLFGSKESHSRLNNSVSLDYGHCLIPSMCTNRLNHIPVRL